MIFLHERQRRFINLFMSSEDMEKKVAAKVWGSKAKLSRTRQSMSVLMSRMTFDEAKNIALWIAEKFKTPTLEEVKVRLEKAKQMPQSSFKTIP